MVVAAAVNLEFSSVVFIKLSPKVLLLAFIAFTILGLLLMLPSGRAEFVHQILLQALPLSFFAGSVCHISESLICFEA